MSFGDSRHHATDAAPVVGRPRGAAWRTLQADGVVWEGQVVIVGGDADLASRMIVTGRRVAFARGGVVVLDLARDWLRPAPILRRDGTMQLSITPPGQSFDTDPEEIILRLRDGNAAAGHLIAMLAGSGARRIMPEAMSSAEYVRGLLPPLPEPRRSAALDRASDERLSEVPLLTAGFDDDPDLGDYGVTRPQPALSPPAATPAPAPLVLTERERSLPPVPPPASLRRDRSWNLPQAETIAPRGVRRRRGWIFRIGGLAIILGASALLGADRLPLPQLLPAAPADAPPPTSTAPAVADTSAGVPTVTESFVSTVMADSTAFVLGIGAEGAAAPTPAPAQAAAMQTTATAVPTIGPPPTNDAAAGAATAADAGETTTASPASSPAAVAAAPAPAATPPPATATPAATTGLTASVVSADLGGTLPAYSLVAPAEGAWLALRLDLSNPSAEPATTTLADFTLVANGAEIAPDRKSVVVGTVLRLSGAPEALDEAIDLDPGETRSLALVFNVPATATEFTLRFDGTELPVEPAVASVSGGHFGRGFATRAILLQAPGPAYRFTPAF